MKKTILLIFTISILFIGYNVVEAKTVNNVPSGEVQLLDNKTVGTKKDKQCTTLFGDPDTKGTLANYLQWGLEIIKYLGIILCIVLTVVDFAKALLGDEKEMYKPLAKKGFSRLMYACCLFFLPIFVEVLLKLIGVYGTCGIG